MDPAKLTRAGPSASGQRACAHPLAALVNHLPNTPAIVVNDIGDVLSINNLARELFSEFTIHDNVVRMTFLDPAARWCADAWRDQARDALGTLRRAYQRAPSNTETSSLVCELLRLSEPFRTMWMQQDRTASNRATRVFPHREVGALVVDEVALGSAAEPGTMVLVYVPAPGSVSDESLRILGSWCASVR
ncbi:hypothetical protein O6P37_13895 [Mycobacterium sp. CPCC 205372]|uniref:MmyB-like transcription regulator ligand binding domain-containing protein n=1 Tax=Mycobacterium hippophais TaxID=3016340 RepID=A0ABT4PTS6_9MYCO|nr:hypothetical protein [Mycobacterium hippophais]MCZ8379961.1 hypothetical protein [Mycobacterium hippophais]